MIKGLYASYVANVARERGAWAFLKWLLLGVLLQIALMLPLAPLTLLAMLFPENLQPAAGSAIFFVLYLAVRAAIFALPCAEVGRRKGRGGRTAWLVAGVVLGMFALGVAAALEPKAAAGRE